MARKNNRSKTKPRIRISVLERDNYKCHYCGKKAITVDHIIPHSHGGPDNRDNLVAACRTCNEARGTMNYKLFKRYCNIVGPPKTATWFSEKSKYRVIAMKRMWQNNVGPIKFLKIAKSKGYNRSLISRAIDNIRKDCNGSENIREDQDVSS